MQFTAALHAIYEVNLNVRDLELSGKVYWIGPYKILWNGRLSVSEWQCNAAVRPTFEMVVVWPRSRLTVHGRIWRRCRFHMNRILKLPSCVTFEISLLCWFSIPPLLFSLYISPNLRILPIFAFGFSITVLQLWCLSVSVRSPFLISSSALFAFHFFPFLFLLHSSLCPFVTFSSTFLLLSFVTTCTGTTFEYRTILSPLSYNWVFLPILSISNSLLWYSTNVSYMDDQFYRICLVGLISFGWLSWGKLGLFLEMCLSSQQPIV